MRKPIRAKKWENSERAAKTRVFLLHKPYDVLSQFTQDHPGQRTLSEFDLPKDVYAAGRLDRDSEGLLLLTNDGALIKRLLDPEHGHERTYLVQVEGDIDESALSKLRNGVGISGYKTKRTKAEKVEVNVQDREPPIRSRKSIPTSWIKLTLTEGKNRQVRRMTAAVGYPTLRLIRVAIGELNLGELAVGQFKELDEEEIRKLKLSLQLSPVTSN